MMRLFTVFLILTVATGCAGFLPDDQPDDIQAESCTFSEEILPPAPFSILTQGEIGTDNYYFHLGNSAPDHLFAMGSKNVGGFPDVQISTDGGNSWTDRSPDIQKAPISICFLDPETGIVSLRDNTGCPDDCQNLCKAILTKDGGKTWEEVTYPGLRGVLNHLRTDQEGNLYAHLWTSSDSSSLVKSTDQGKTFEILYTGQTYGSQTIVFSHVVTDNKIIAAGQEAGVILVFDHSGTLLQTLNTGINGSIQGIELLSDQTWILSTSIGAYLTENAGSDWTLLREGRSRILYASLSNDQQPEILLSVNTGYCPTDVIRAKDVLAYSSDGGTTWNDSDPVENMNLGFSYQLIHTDQSSSLIMLQDHLLEFSR